MQTIDDGFLKAIRRLVITTLILIGIAVIVLGVVLGRWANDYFSIEAYRVPQRWLVAVHDFPKGHILAKEDIA